MPGANPAAQVLARLGDGDGLLVLDNLEAPWNADEAPVEEALARLVDFTSARVVASIRGTAWPGQIDWRWPLRLEPLPADQARELFLRVAGEGYADDPDLDAIVSALDGLPLAIGLLARQAQGSKTLAGLRADFEERKGKLFELGDTKALSLKASLQLSIDSPRMTAAGKRLYTTMGRLPAGAALRDLNKLISGGGHAAGRVLCQLGVAFEEGQRLRMLAPIREHAALRTMRDVKRIVAHYLDLARNEGEKIGHSCGAEAVTRLSPEIANLEAAVDLAIKARLVPEALPALAGLAALIEFTGIGSTRPIQRLVDAGRQTRDLRVDARGEFHIGEIARRRSQHEEARERFERALALFRKVGDMQGEAVCITSLGEVELGRPKHEQAGKRFEAALQLYSKVGDVGGQGRCIMCIGQIALWRSQKDEAQKQFEAALVLFRAVGGVLGEANCLFSLGQIALQRSQDDNASNRFEAAQRLYRQVGDSGGEANCICGLAELALARSQHKEALKRLTAALELYRKFGDVQGQARCTQGFGQIALEQSNYDDAKGHFERAMSLCREAGSLDGEAICEWGYAEIARKLGRNATAQVHYAPALMLFRQVYDQVGEARCLLGQGRIGRALGRANAESRLRQAFSLFDSIHHLEGRGEALLELAKLAEDVEAKRELLLDALDSHSRFGNPYWIGETHHRLARLSESDEHHRHITAARDAWTSIERPDRFAELDAELDGN